MPDKDAKKMTPSEQLLFDWNPVTNSGNPNPSPPMASNAAPNPKPDSTESIVSVTEAESERVESAEPGYDAGHPWHYLPQGDNAPPLPFDAIPPNEEAGRSLERDLPKSMAKRIIKVRELLEAEWQSLEDTRIRYEDVISRGAEALGRYDREIAYGGNDEMARAGTLALLVNQISWRRGRIEFLERQQSRPLVRRR